MNKMFKYILLFIFALLIIPSVKAEETCDYKYRAEVSKIAKNVSASYEIKQDNNGDYYYDFTIYNIVDGIYVQYTRESDTYGTSYVRIFPYDADENGNYTFKVTNIYTIDKYTFKVFPVNSACDSSLKTFSITKPMYNSYSELDECKFYGVEDYFYCQKWITNKIKLTRKEVIERVQQQRKNNNKTVETRCLSCEENEKISAKIARFNKIKKYVIIGLSVGILVDLVFIVFIIIRLKQDTL